MNEAKTADEVDAQPAESTPAETDPATSAKKGGRAIGLVIVLSLIWYLAADRFTPYTSQARVDGYVVGVAPQVAGVVTDVFVKNSQAIESGQRLFQIERSQYEIAVQKARSDLESAHRQVEAGAASVEAAQAGLLSARANEVKAEKDFDRLTRLRAADSGTISVRRIEQSQATLDSARARVTQAQSSVQAAIEQMGGEDEADNAILKSARAALEKAELDLSNTLVIASAAGIITDLSTDIGLYAGTGSPVMTLISVDDVWINAEFTENNLGHLKIGSEVEVLFDVMPGRVYSGSVRSLGLGVNDGKDHPPGTLPTVKNDRDWLRQAQRFPVLIDIDAGDAKDLRGQLRIGGQASVIGYTEGHGILNLLGEFYIRLMSWLAYAY